MAPASGGEIRRARVGRALAWLIGVVLVAAGCVPAPPMWTGKPIDRDSVAGIRRGATTKQELLERFGMPMAIAARDESVAVPSPSAHGGDAPRSGGYYEVGGETFFELFSSRHAPVDSHRVYYYYHAFSTKTGYVGLFVVYERAMTRVEHLWVLVDEKTGIVEDYVFRK